MEINGNGCLQQVKSKFNDYRIYTSKNKIPCSYCGYIGNHFIVRMVYKVYNRMEGSILLGCFECRHFFRSMFKVINHRIIYYYAVTI